MNKSEHINELAAALVGFQNDFEGVEKNAQVQFNKVKFKYADLASIFNSIKKPMQKHKLAITQLINGSELTTMLVHASGQYIESSMPLNQHADPKQYGSLITYYKRYAVQAILGICAEDDLDAKALDDNANTGGYLQGLLSDEWLEYSQGLFYQGMKLNNVIDAIETQMNLKLGNQHIKQLEEVSKN